MTPIDSKKNESRFHPHFAWLRHTRDPRRWSMFIAGIVLLSASVAIVVRSQLGVSVLASVPYMLSLIFDFVTLGTWNYIVQGVLMVALILLLRRFKAEYVVAFGVAVGFGLAIDLFTRLFANLPQDSVLFRISYFVVGLLFLSAGVAMFIRSGFPMLPFDLFVKEIAEARGMTFRKVKTIFDLTFLAISVVLMLVVVREFKGVGIGTIVSAVINGSLMHFWMHAIDRLMPDLAPAREKAA